MVELKTYDDIHEFSKAHERIGYLGSDDTCELQSPIWIMELYKKDNLNDTEYFLRITMDDGSVYVLGFDPMS